MRVAAAAATVCALAVVPALAPAAATARRRQCVPSVTHLPNLGYGGAASAIHRHTIAGGVYNASGEQRPAIWRYGRLAPLGPSGGVAFDINRSDEVVGVAGGFTQAFPTSVERSTCSGRTTVARSTHGA